MLLLQIFRWFHFAIASISLLISLHYFLDCYGFTLLSFIAITLPDTLLIDNILVSFHCMILIIDYYH